MWWQWLIVGLHIGVFVGLSWAGVAYRRVYDDNYIREYGRAYAGKVSDGESNRE